jgi:hypothetical protein
MNDKFVLYGLLLGLLLGVIYLLTAWKKNVKPEINDFFIILIAAYSVVLSINLLVTVLSCSKEYLGNFKDERIAIILGGISMLWISIEQLPKMILLNKTKRPINKSITDVATKSQ